jgi:hypothetical protein
MFKFLISLTILFLILNIILYLTIVKAKNSTYSLAPVKHSGQSNFDLQILNVKSVQSISLLESLLRYKFILDQSYYNKGGYSYFLYRGATFKIIESVGNTITADAQKENENYQSTTHMKNVLFLFFK